MNDITPCIWFRGEAEAAMELTKRALMEAMMPMVKLDGPALEAAFAAAG